MWRNRNRQPQGPPDYWSQSIDWIDSCIPWECFRTFRRGRWFNRCRTWDTNICCGLFGNCCRNKRQESQEAAPESARAGAPDRDVQTSSRESGGSSGCLCASKTKHGPFCFGRQFRTYAADTTSVPKRNTGYSKLLNGQHHGSPASVESPSNRCLNPVAFPKTNVNSISDIRLLSASRKGTMRSSRPEERDSVVFFQGCCGYATFKPNCCTGHPYLSRCQSLSDSLLSSKKDYEIVFFQGKCGYACFDSNCCRLWETMHYNMRDDSEDGNESKCSSPTHSNYFPNHNENELEIACIGAHARETTVTEFHQEGNSQSALSELLVLSCGEHQQTSGLVGSKMLQGYLKQANMKSDGVALVHTDFTELNDYAESQFHQDSLNMKNDEAYEMNCKKLNSEIEIENVFDVQGNKSDLQQSCDLKICNQVIERESETEPGMLRKNAENISSSPVSSALNGIDDSEEQAVAVNEAVKQESEASDISTQAGGISSEVIQQKLDEQPNDQVHAFDMSTESNTVTSEMQTRLYENISSVAVDSALSEADVCKQSAAIFGDLANTHLETSVKNEKNSFVFVSYPESEIHECEQKVNEFAELPNAHLETSSKDENISSEDAESSLSLPSEVTESNVQRKSSCVSTREMQSLAAEISFRAINAAMVECDNSKNRAVGKSPQSKFARHCERFEGHRVFDAGSGERCDVQMDGHDKELLFVHLTVSPVFEYGPPTGSSVLLDSDSDDNPYDNQACYAKGSFGVRGLRKAIADGCIDSSRACEDCMDNVHAGDSPKDGMTKDSDRLERRSRGTRETYKQCRVVPDDTSDESTPQRVSRHDCVQDESVNKTISFSSRKVKGVIHGTPEHRAKQKLLKKKKKIKSELDRKYGSIVDVSKHRDFLLKSLKLISKVNPEHKCYKKYERTTSIKSHSREGQGRNDHQEVKKKRKRTKTEKVECRAGKKEKKKKTKSVTATSKKTTTINCKPVSDQHGKHDSVLGNTENTASDDTFNTLCSSLQEELHPPQLTTDNRADSCEIDSVETRSEDSRISKTSMESSLIYFEDDTRKCKPEAEINLPSYGRHSKHSPKGATYEASNQMFEGTTAMCSPCHGEGLSKEDPPKSKSKRKQTRKTGKVEKKKKTQTKRTRTQEAAPTTPQPMILEHELDDEDHVPGTSDNCKQLTNYKSSSDNSSLSRMRSEPRKQFREDMAHDLPLHTDNVSVSLERGSDCHDLSVQESNSPGVLKDSLFCEYENDKELNASLTKRKSQKSISIDSNQLRVVPPKYEHEILQACEIPEGKGKCERDEERPTVGALIFKSDEQPSLNTDSSDLAEQSSQKHKRSTKHSVSVTHDSYVPMSCRCKQLEKAQSQSACFPEVKHNAIQPLSACIDPPLQMTHNPSYQAGQSISSPTLTRRPPLSNCIPWRSVEDTDKGLLHQSRGHNDLLYDPRVDILVGESIVKALSDLTRQDSPVQTHPTLCAGNILNDPEKSTHKLKPEEVNAGRAKHHLKTKKNGRSGAVSRSPKLRKCSLNTHKETSSVLAPDFEIPVLKSDGFYSPENQNKSVKSQEYASQDVSCNKKNHEENNLPQKIENDTKSHCLSLDLDYSEKKATQEKDCPRNLVRDKQRKTTHEGIEDENGRSGNELLLPRKVSQRMLPGRPVTSRGSEIPALSSQTRNKKTKTKIPVPGHAVYVGSVKHSWINTQRADRLSPGGESPIGHTQAISIGNRASESNSLCVATGEGADNQAINKGTRDSGGKQPPANTTHTTCAHRGLVRSDGGRIHTDDSGTCKVGKSKKKQSRKRIVSKKPDPCSIPRVSDLSGNLSHDQTENQRIINHQDETRLISVVNQEPKGTANASTKADSTPNSHGSIDNEVTILGRNVASPVAGAVTESESTALNDSSPGFSTDRDLSQINVISSPLYGNIKGVDPWIDFHEQSGNRDSDAAIKISGDTEILTIENIDFSSEAELFSEQLSILHDNELTDDSQGAPNDSQQLDAYIFSADKRVARCASENSYIPPYDDNELSERQNNTEYGYNICLNPHNSFSPGVTSASIPSRGYFRYDPSSPVRGRLPEDKHTGIVRPCRSSLESRLSIDIAEGIVNGQDKDPTDAGCVSDYVREYNELCKSSIDTERRILKSVLQSVRGCYSSGSTEDPTQEHVGHLGVDCSENNQYRRNSCLIDSRTNHDDDEPGSCLNRFQATDSDIGSSSGNNQHILSQKENEGHVLFKAIAEETDEELRAELSVGLNRRGIREHATASFDRRKRLQRQTCVAEGGESGGVASKRVKHQGKRHPKSQGKIRCDTLSKQGNANKANEKTSGGRVTGVRTLKRPPLKNLNTKLQPRKGIPPTTDKADGKCLLNKHPTNPTGPRRSTAAVGNATRVARTSGSEGARSQNSLDDVVVVEKERNKRGGIVKKEKRCKTKRKISYHDKDGQRYRTSTVSVKSEKFEEGFIPTDDSVGFTPKPGGETFSQNMSYRNRKDSRGTRERGRWSSNDNDEDRYEDVTEGRNSVGKLSRYSDTDQDIHLRKSPRYETRENGKGVYSDGRFEDVTDDLHEADGSRRRHRQPQRGSTENDTPTELGDHSGRRGANSFIKEKVASDEEYVTMIAQGKISFMQDLEGWREAYDLDSDVIEAEARKLMAGDLRNLYRDLPERDRREVVRNIEYMDSLTHDDLMKSLRT